MKYRVVFAGEIRCRDKDNQRISLKTNQIVTADDLSPAVFADLVEQGWIECIEPEAVEAPEGTDGNPLRTAFHPVEQGEEPKPVTVEQEHGLDADALDALDAESLLVMVGERVEEGREAVQTALRGLEDPKASAIEFLLSDYADQQEFIAACVEQAEEQEKVEKVIDEVKGLDEELPPKPKSMIGKTVREE
jgi:hypothetical protein